MPNQKVHEWLSEIASHGIYEYTEMMADFEECTGHEPPDIPKHSVPGTMAAIQERGVGGNYSGDTTDTVAWGWEISEALADRFVPGKSKRGMYTGRGRRFDADVDALREAGI